MGYNNEVSTRAFLDNHSEAHAWAGRTRCGVYRTYKGYEKMVVPAGLEPASRPNLGLAGYKAAALPLS